MYLCGDGIREDRSGGFEVAKHIKGLLTREGYSVSFDLNNLTDGDFNKELSKDIVDVRFKNKRFIRDVPSDDESFSGTRRASAQLNLGDCYLKGEGVHEPKQK